MLYSSEDITKLFGKFIEFMNMQANDSNPILAEYGKEYLQHIRENNSTSYYRSCKIALNHLNNYFPERMRVRDLTIPDIEKFMIHLQSIVKRGWRVYFKNYKAMFSRAVLLGYTKENLFSRIKIRRSQELKHATVNSDELKSIKKHLKNKNVNDITDFAYQTGVRISEAIFLIWQCINFTDRTITIGSESFTTKTRRQRIIPMSDEVYGLLASRLPKIFSPSGFVFAKKDGSRFTANYVSHRFKRAVRKAGISEQITFHSLRHSCASNLIAKGCSIYLVKELLGHSSVVVTELYSRGNVEAIRNEMNKVNNLTKQNITKAI